MPAAAVLVIMRVTVVVAATIMIVVMLMRMMMLMGMAVIVTTAVVVMGMIMAVIMTAACAFILGIGQEIEKPQHHHADAADEHQRAKESIRRQIARHAPADVKVEHHTAPENEEQHAEQMNEKSLCFHDDENGGLTRLQTI